MQKIVGLIGTKGAGKDTAAEHFYKKGFKGIAYADALYQEVCDAFSVTRNFLSHRATKEKNTFSLSLIHCKDRAFIEKLFEKIQSNVIVVADSNGKLIPNFHQKPYWKLELLLMPQSPRTILQWWGSQYKRDLDDSYWINKVANVIKSNPQSNFVVTDVRFLNEAALVRELQGITIRVKRDKIDQELLARIKSGDPNASHISETQLLGFVTDFELENKENDRQYLEKSVEELFNDKDFYFLVKSNSEKTQNYLKT